MHLHLKFESIKGQLLHTSPLPTLDVALSNLIAEGIRLRVLGSSCSAEPTTMLAAFGFRSSCHKGQPFSSRDSTSLLGAAIVTLGAICSRIMPRRSKVISVGNNPPLQQLLLLMLNLILLRCSMMSQPLQPPM
ncbi:conserved hypothetical protein [Ricinus communis]|uniref:Uncharacterized protein n=1 Tax=Ricinus communis TaxID=3988 RepID=B9SUR1_RICCO|nr:conserved hypothetical protein [Ricinus communis]